MGRRAFINRRRKKTDPGGLCECVSLARPKRPQPCRRQASSPELHAQRALLYEPDGTPDRGACFKSFDSVTVTSSTTKFEVKRDPMMKPRLTALLIIAVGGIAAAPPIAFDAIAQQSASPPTQKPCPTPEQQRQQAGRTNAAGNELPAAQPMEKSGILPAVGEDKASSAPTVQQQVTTPNAGPDCVLSPTHPNSLNQGPAEKILPPFSK